MKVQDQPRISADCRLREDLEQYFYEVAALCPYGLQHKAVFKQALLWKLPDHILELFLDAGYRRNGNSLYTMNCQGCRACVPIRLRASEFTPNRNQQRALRANRDVTVERGPLQVTEEKLAVLERFLAQRYPRQGSSAADYYSGFFINSLTTTMEVSYRVEGRLHGLAIVDFGRHWANAVYFFFDPREAGRSPGTFNILHLIQLCRDKGIDFLYLGYWIDQVAAMRYKTHFRPHYLLQEGVWQRYAR